MRFITIFALLIGSLPTAAHGQDRGKPRVRIDVSAGLALPSSPWGFRTFHKTGPELVVDVLYRLSPILDLRVYGEAILLHSTPPDNLLSGRQSVDQMWDGVLKSAGRAFDTVRGKRPQP